MSAPPDSRAKSRSRPVDACRTLKAETEELNRRGRVAEAVRRIERELATTPDQPELQVALGLARAADNDSAGAAECLQTAVRLRPEYAEAHYHLGNLALKVGRLEEAEAAFRAALEFGPATANCPGPNWGRTCCRIPTAWILAPGRPVYRIPRNFGEG